MMIQIPEQLRLTWQTEIDIDWFLSENISGYLTLAWRFVRFFTLHNL